MCIFEFYKAPRKQNPNLAASFVFNWYACVFCEVLRPIGRILWKNDISLWATTREKYTAIFSNLNLLVTSVMNQSPDWYIQAYFWENLAYRAYYCWSWHVSICVLYHREGRCIPHILRIFTTETLLAQLCCSQKASNLYQRNSVPSICSSHNI